jgi:hypothetical protein
VSIKGGLERIKSELLGLLSALGVNLFSRKKIDLQIGANIFFYFFPK